MTAYERLARASRFIADAGTRFRKSGKPGSVYPTLEEIMPHVGGLHKEAKKRALRRGIPWALTKEQVRDLLIETKGACALTGLPFSFRRYGDARRRPFVPSIDRIKASDGYTFDNTRIICAAVNVALAEWGLPVLAQIAIGMRDFTPDPRVVR